MHACSAIIFAFHPALISFAIITACLHCKKSAIPKMIRCHSPPFFICHACLSQVLGVAERADAMIAVEFLNKRGGNVKWCSIAEPPGESDWHTKGAPLPGSIDEKQFILLIFFSHT